MTDYIPFKYRPGRLTSNYIPFRHLKEAIKPKKYTVKDEGSFRFNHIEIHKPEVFPYLIPVRDLARKIFNDKLAKDFPDQYDSSCCILRCFEASMHRDQDWSKNLFLCVVVHAAPKGHVLFGTNWHADPKAENTAQSIIVRTGDVFLLDPLSIHSVHSRSQKKEELILLQYELEYESREHTEEVMRKCRYEYSSIM